MRNRTLSIKHALVAVAGVAAVSLAPAHANSPTLVDTGSNFSSVSISGSDFTPNADVYIVALDKYDGTDLQHAWVHTSSYFGCTQYGCYGGGDFDYYGVDAVRCSGVGRNVWAWDSAELGWHGPLSVGCFTPPA